MENKELTIPKKPNDAQIKIGEDEEPTYIVGHCPNCGKGVFTALWSKEQTNECPFCKQALDWKVDGGF